MDPNGGATLANGVPRNPRLDIETVEHDYRASLADLTFNSKPIITNLTIIAQENTHAASVIVRAIEQQIRNLVDDGKTDRDTETDVTTKVNEETPDHRTTHHHRFPIPQNPPGQKLPVLYLLDSICKNVGGNYINLFSRNIVSTFLDAYTLVDGPTRHSFERLLQTWKSGLPNGAPVFGRHVIETIERALGYGRQRGGPQHHGQQAYHHQQQQQQQQPQPQQQQQNGPIHVNPNFVQGMGNRDPRQQQGQRISPRMSEAPVPYTSSSVATGSQSYGSAQPSGYNTYQQPQYNEQTQQTAANTAVLQGLQALLPQQNAAQVLGSAIGTTSQILAQLQSILPSLPPSQAQAIQLQITQLLANAPPIPQSTLSQPQAILTSTPIPTISSPSPAFVPAPQLLPVAAPTVVPTTVPAMNAGALLRNLMDSGLLGGISAANVGAVLTGTPPPVTSVSAFGTPAPQPQALTPQMASQALPQQQQQQQQVSVEEVRTMSLRDLGRIELSNKDLQVKRPGAIDLLYAALPLQCKQCGFRYPKTPDGQTKMDAHLDWHFRQNRRMKERAKRGLSRSWFVTEEEWISGAGGEVTQQQAPAFFDDSSSGPVGSASAASIASKEANDKETQQLRESTVVAPMNDQGKPCPICGEQFLTIFSDAEDEWMLKNAVELEGVIYHATCHAEVIKNQESYGTNGALGADGLHVLVPEEHEGNVYKKRRIDEVGRSSVGGAESMDLSFN
ncbi:hypothetical protein BC936DRAFT_137876 [Jimgerdemannia flammicorona]|uniref:CID domain-containing protein n=1 Tax=Jimgerdemannia flammicorona TaxID=994334 RepID=A0A433CWH8_9FUNG|nr:hypothetical protein BC936DRAFT_137876 [Jimgerdemannia flammicorona]